MDPRNLPNENETKNHYSKLIQSFELRLSRLTKNNNASGLFALYKKVKDIHTSIIKGQIQYHKRTMYGKYSVETYKNKKHITNLSILMVDISDNLKEIAMIPGVKYNVKNLKYNLKLHPKDVFDIVFTQKRDEYKNILKSKDGPLTKK